MAAMFYSLDEAVRRLNTTRDELKAMVEQGKLREFRDGLDRLFRIDEVEAIAPATGKTPADEVASPEDAEHTTPDPDVLDIEIKAEAATPENDDVGLGATESEEADADVPSFDIRVELGMLDGEGAVAEHPITHEAAESATFTDELIAEELIEDEPPAAPEPPQPTPRPVPMGYPHVSQPKKSAWQWLVCGLRDDRPAAVVVLFLLLGIMLSGCATAAYFLHKLL